VGGRRARRSAPHVAGDVTEGEPTQGRQKDAPTRSRSMWRRRVSCRPRSSTHRGTIPGHLLVTRVGAGSPGPGRHPVVILRQRPGSHVGWTADGSGRSSARSGTIAPAWCTSAVCGSSGLSPPAKRSMPLRTQPAASSCWSWPTMWTPNWSAAAIAGPGRGTPSWASSLPTPDMERGAPKGQWNRRGKLLRGTPLSTGHRSRPVQRVTTYMILDSGRRPTYLGGALGRVHPVPAAPWCRSGSMARRVAMTWFRASRWLRSDLAIRIAPGAVGR